MKAPAWLLDSNAVMGYLNQEPAPGFLARIEQCLLEGASVSLVTLIEVLGWRGHDERSRADARALLQSLPVLGLTEAVETRRSHCGHSMRSSCPMRSSRPPGWVHRIVLVTRNVQDFERVAGLDVQNPFNPWTLTQA